MMKGGFVLALIASVSMTVLSPMASFAASHSSASPRAQTISKHVQHGHAVLTQAQLEGLAQSNPRLYAKILAHKQDGSVLVLTVADAKSLQALNKRTLDELKAGTIALSALIPLGIIVVEYTIKLLAGDKAPSSMFMQVFFCTIGTLFGYTQACAAPSEWTWKNVTVSVPATGQSSQK